MLVEVSLPGIIMDLLVLRAIFRYNSKTGRLYRGRTVVKGTPTYPGSRTLVVGVKGRILAYARVCFFLLHGYEPKMVRHRDRDASNNRGDNLYDPTGGPQDKKVVPKAHEGKYPFVSVIRDQRTGRHRGYQGSVYFGARRHRTPVVETPEMARDLRLLLAAQLEWLESQKENAQ